MTTDIIVLNGASSSGKSGIARCLQAILPDPWLTLGVDDLLRAMPRTLMESSAGITIGQQGEVSVGDTFKLLDEAWMTGVAAMARAGARIIIDDVFLGGGASQERIRAHLDGLDVLWAGVHCEPGVAAGREIARGDRVAGMNASQAQVVHRGVVYDIEVDTTDSESMDCARAIPARVI